MLNIKEKLNPKGFQASYEANKVEGRSNFCPRIGFYKILTTKQGICLGKPASIALVNWKLNEEASYSNNVYQLQLETFKKDDANLQVKDLSYKELQVSSATWDSYTKQFSVEWNVINEFPWNIDDYNNLLLSGFVEVDLDATKEVDQQIEDLADTDEELLLQNDIENWCEVFPTHEFINF